MKLFLISRYLVIALVSLAPSCWDTGSDMYQGEKYLNGDIYMKNVNSMNDAAIINSNCTWVKTTQTALDNQEIEVIYTYECFEKNVLYGWGTLFIVFCLPGFVNFTLRKKIFPDHESNRKFGLKKIAIQCCTILILIMAVPFFPLQIFLVKLLALLTEGTEMNKISTYMSLFEGVSESSPQLILQLFIIFTSINRQPSTTQLLTLSGSIIFIVKSLLQHHFSEMPNVPLKRKLLLFPQKLCYIAFVCGGSAIIMAVFQFWFAFFMLTHAAIRFFLLSTRKGGNFKAEVSTVVRDAIIFVKSIVLLILITYAPDTTIYSLIFTDGHFEIFQTKLSDTDFKNRNYIMITCIICGVISYALWYLQIVKPKKSIKVSDKENPDNVFKTSIETIKESPINIAVLKVSIDGKTYIVPKNDLNLEQYPLDSDVRSVVKCSNEKEKCNFENLKTKICCTCCHDKTPPKTKTYIVRKEDLKRVEVEKENICQQDDQEETIGESEV